MVSLKGVVQPAIAPSSVPGWVILGVTVLAQAALSVPNQGIPPLAPFLKEDLNLSRAQVGVIITAVMLGQLALSLVSGWLTDTVGVRKTLALACLMSGLGMAPMALGGGYGHVLVFALVASTGAGLGNPATSKAIVDWFPLRMRATAMGVKQTGVPLAGAIFAATLPAIALAAGWRTAALVLGGSALVATVVFYAVYRDAERPIRAASDLRSGLKAIRSVASNHNIVVTATLASVLVGVQFCLLTYIILYLRDTFDVPVVVGGVLLAVMQVSALVARIGMGLLSDRVLHGRRKVVLVGAGGCAALFLAALGLLPVGAPFLVVLVLTVLVGVAAIGWHAVYHTSVAESAGPGLIAPALGFASMFSAMGALVGPPAFGLIADGFGYRPAWFALAGVAALATIGYLLIMREVRQGVERP